MRCAEKHLSHARSLLCRALVFALLFISVALNLDAREKGIRGSKHDLSLTGPGPTKSAHEREICVFCHAPHGTASDAPLWNRYSSGATYETYRSSTAKAKVGQPTGASKLCLSCHDGTIALGMVRSRRTPIRFAGGVVTMPSGSANLTTDLSDDHPISFPYDADLVKASGGNLKDPDALKGGPVHLDSASRMQCTTCHDPHDNFYGKFMVMDNKESALCVSCHAVEYWEASSHRNSTATWNGKNNNPLPNQGRRTVKDNGCRNCHASHNAGTKERLLIYDTEEGNCLSCHNGSVSSKNIEADFEKRSRHMVEESNGIHDSAESVIPGKRHVECFDCHNGHAVKNAPAVAPVASGALAGVPGIDASGASVAAVDKQYELCFRCHADSPDRGLAVIPRQDANTNLREEFDTSNASHHPVVGAGKNSNVPSLLADYDETSWIYCTDCHSSNTGKKGGGKGANGPHGSAYRPILERRMEFQDNLSENAASYALCYKCHSRDSILADESFPEHRLHVTEVKASCTTCHDPHGVKDNTHLINFNVDYVRPNSLGELKWEDLGELSGKCYLTCHGEDHAPREYPVSVEVINGGAE